MTKGMFLSLYISPLFVLLKNEVDGPLMVPFIPGCHVKLFSRILKQI